MTNNEAFFGRQLPLRTAPTPELTGTPALKALGSRLQCQRCGHWLGPDDQLANQAWYCRQCLQLGRLTSQDKLYTIPEPNQLPKLANGGLTWTGELSAQQRVAAQSVLARVQSQTNHLLWAVTGAGKTEIVYPALAWALSQGWRVAWTSPRVDVCLELAPRLQAAFANVPQTVLYGDQPQPYRYCPLTVCTTHQLLRFKAAFDLIVVDEVDAFPLATSPMLKRAIDHAQKPSGCHLYLTATPGERLQRRVARKELAVTYVPLRYHGHLLPQIDLQIAWRWREQLRRRKLPARLIHQLRGYLRAGQRFLLFVPHVADLTVVDQALHLAGITGGVTVHAADEARQEKVQAMRDQKVAFLVTTTILERGVTFPNVAVVILGGDDPVFSTAALVQIAGRVGRSAQFPTGDVTCYCHSYARRVRLARGMIARLNLQGRRQGGRP
ncbi:MAG: DNA/RNA helicase [Levilactobacillus sp.]|jgi:competence protein ComFA|uniref:DEAD/DEAH box helicase n=1 Tax=Levilactobacillus sp. TaxID=2767919 RepID=UPI00258BCCD2|nr:helicase-related protein [Levilactobacillus sp.]MCH4124056.1 DNA/RNA helicase [Levilactobacillus sp.]MCI1554108.1 DNA/RNA helicase [Levilactobacillus sp.]MCI1599946.1 DNA/RNA helicase [Levilactobacillus sp.]MCI1606767.1 DNA/RNA helicase [Levilactobacillus sp.]